MSASRIEVLFIGGWGRSGSTLLSRMVGRLPGFVSVGELRELWRRGVVEDRLCGCGAQFHECEYWSAVGKEAYGGWSRDLALQMETDGRRFDSLARGRWFRADAGEEGRDYLARLVPLYRAIRDVSGGQVVVDSSKLANYGAVVAGSPEVNLRLVHLVRDARGVANSWRKEVSRPDGTAGDGMMERYGPLAAAGRYDLYNSMTDVLARRCEHAITVRYEDLIAQPAIVIEDMLVALGYPMAGNSFDWIDGANANLGFCHTVDGNPMRLQRGEVRLSVDDGWHTQLPSAHRSLVTGLTLPLLWRYKYLRARRKP